MCHGVGRLLVDDGAQRAAAAGASHVDVIANPNVVGFYSSVGFELTGQSTTRFGSAPRMTLALGRRDDPPPTADGAAAAADAGGSTPSNDE